MYSVLEKSVYHLIVAISVELPVYLFKYVDLLTWLLWRERLFRIHASELSLISSKTFALPPVHFCEEIDRGQLAYATICDKSDCFGSTLLFFFVEPTHGWSTHGIQFFFNFQRKLNWYVNKSVYLLKFIFKLFYLALFFWTIDTPTLLRKRSKKYILKKCY